MWIVELKSIGWLLGMIFILTLVKGKVTAESACPQDIDQLMTELLADLPDYTNRVISRAQSLERDLQSSRYVLVAGKANFEPIPVTNLQYNPVFEQESPTQVFFTTLERRYLNLQAVETQSFHWMFLTNTPNGWRLVMLFSRQENIRDDQIPTPPRESNQTAIAQGIRLWLRDCQYR